jgi:Neuraminidase-like domain
MSPDDRQEPRLTEAVAPLPDGLLDVEVPEPNVSDTLDAERYLIELSREEPDLYEEAADLEEALRDALLEAYPDATPGEIEESLLNVLIPLPPAESTTVPDPASPSTNPTARALGVPPGAQTEASAFEELAGVPDSGSVAPETLAAVSAVDQAKGLPPTDVVNASTLAGGPATATAFTGAGAGTAASGKQLPAGTVVGGPSGGSSPQVSGTIVLEHGSPASAVKVRLYQRDLGGTRTPLGEGQTDQGGSYTIPYSAKGAVNVEVYAIGADGNEVQLSQPMFGAKSEEHLDLVAPSSVQPPAAEFTRLKAAVAAHNDNKLEVLKDAVEQGARQDFSYLAGQTGWDRGALALASEAFSTETLTKIPADGLYAMARAGLPTDARAFAMVPTKTVATALRQAAEAGIVDAAVVDKSVQAFRAFAADYRFNHQIQGAVSTPKEFVGKARISSEDRTVFSQVVREEKTEDLWERAKTAGVSEDGIQTLQLQGKLAYLTFNNVELADYLLDQVSTDPLQLIELGYYDKEQWKQALRDLAGGDANRLSALIPPAFPGNSAEERLDAYTEELARRVRQMDPHAVTVDRIASGKIDGVPQRDDVGRFLQNAAPLGFRLGATPVGAFVAANETAVWNGVADSRRDATLEGVRTLSSLYAVSPTDEAMNALLVAGYTSATGIAMHDYGAFAERVNLVLQPHPKAGDQEITQRIYWKAQQQSATVYNVFEGLKRLSTVSYAPGSSPEDVKKRDDQIVKVREKLSGLFPTLEALFGTVDYCECEHCQSVLSPAAYLVDLLHFIDPNNEAWATVKASYRARTGSDYAKQKLFDAMNSRRPDIKNIALTCENTNVALPYIDLVNEVLEQLMMASETPPAIEAYDVGEASSQDLMAEPQNILWSAYIGGNGKPGLRDLVYPITLPFDLPLEMVRGFLRQLQLPLWQLRQCLVRPSRLTSSASGRTDGWTDIWFERLGLGARDVAALTQSDQWHLHYGYDSVEDALKTEATADGTRPTKMSLRNAKTLARRLDITYQELVELVRTRFINPEIENLIALRRLGVDPDTVDRYFGEGQPLSDGERTELEAELGVQGLQPNDLRPLRTDAIRNSTLVLRSPSVGCDFAKTTLAFDRDPADPGQAMALALRKLNAFVRLQKRLGWETHELDRVLMALMPGVASLTMTTWPQAMTTTLTYLAHVEELRERFQDRLSREELLILWSDIPTVGVSCLYERLFLSPAVLGRDAAFRKRLGRVLEDGAAQLNDHTDAVRQALQVAHEDIEPILVAGHATDRVAGHATDRALSIANLSILMRHAVLAKGLDLSIPELLVLLSFSDHKPLQPLDGGTLSNGLANDVPWTETLAFVDEVELDRDAGVDVAFLDRVCRHRGVEQEPTAEKDPVLLALLALPPGDPAVPEKAQLVRTQTLAAQLSAPEALVDYLLGSVLKDSTDNPLKETGFSDPTRTAESLRRLRRALDLVQSLGITEAELAYLGRDPAALDPNDLPLAEVRDEATARDLRKKLTPWLELVVARNQLGRAERLLAVLSAASQPIDATNTLDARQKQLYDALAGLTGRKPAWLAAALDAVGATSAEGPTFEVSALADPASLRQTLESLRCFIRLGLNPKDVVQLASVSVDETVAQKVRSSVKGRYSTSAWRRLVKPIFDTLRKKQRDALVAHLTHVMDGDIPKYGDTTEKLFEYLLLDPGMEPVVLASRIQLAISSVQLFVQRCLMNLEQESVDPRIIDIRRWEWMRRYRVWEVNRKMFIWPENWLDPEFRDDRTHIFRDLEGKLLQGDVSDDLVRSCFNDYLKGLEAIARLEMLTMYYEPGMSADGAIIHVVGRTPSAPHKYFYRRVSHGTWTPWEPIDVGIEGEHLVLTAWRGRMHLFWVSFLEQAQESSTVLPKTFKPGSDVVALGDLRGTTRIKLQLHWVEQVQGKWVNRSSTSSHVDTAFDGLKATTDAEKREFFVRAVLVGNAAGVEDDDLEIQVTTSGASAHKFTFFSKLAPPRSEKVGIKPPPPPFGGSDEKTNAEVTKWTADGALQVRFVSAVSQSSETGRRESGEGFHKILGGQGDFSLLFPSNETLPAPARTPPSGVGRPTGFVFRPQNAQHVAYRSSDGSIYDLFWTKNGWFYQSPSADAESLSPADESESAVSDPHGYAVDERGTICIAYAGATKLHELVWSQLDPALDDETYLATGWRIETLYKASSQPEQPQGRPYGGIFLPRRGVVFRTKDGRLRAAVEPQAGGPWQIQELNTGLPATASDPTGLLMTRTDLGVTTVVSRHIFYLGADGDVHELRSDVGGQTWTHTNITQPIPSAVKPAPGSSLAAYAFLGQNTVHVVYRGVDDRIHELWGPPGAWNHNPIGATFTKATGDPAGYVTESFGTQHVVYRGEGDQVVELWWSDAWREHILTMSVSAAPKTKSDVAGYSFEAFRTQHVVYLAGDGSPRELYWNIAGWYTGAYELQNPFPDALGPLASPFFYEASAKDHTFFVEPYVVETAVHEWTEWIVTTRQYVDVDVDAQFGKVILTALNPNAIAVAASPTSIIKKAAKYSETVFDQEAIVLTAKGVLSPKLKAEPGTVVLGTPFVDSKPTKVIDVRPGWMPELQAVEFSGGGFR